MQNSLRHAGTLSVGFPTEQPLQFQMAPPQGQLLGGGHRPQSSSASRFTAGPAGFLNPGRVSH
jgi:hypothetical protein